MIMRKNSLNLMLGSALALTATIGCGEDADTDDTAIAATAGASGAAGRATARSLDGENDDRRNLEPEDGTAGSGGNDAESSGSNTAGNNAVGGTGGTANVGDSGGSGTSGGHHNGASDTGGTNAAGGNDDSGIGGDQGVDSTGGSDPNGGGSSSATGGRTWGGWPSTGGRAGNTGGSPGTGGSGETEAGGDQGSSGSEAGGDQGSGGSEAGGDQGLGGSETGGEPGSGGGGNIVPSDGMIGDHFALDDFDALTDEDRARVNELSILYGHRSHGAQMSRWGEPGDEGGLLALSHLYNSEDLYIPAGLDELDGVDLGTYLDSPAYDWVVETNNYLQSNPGTDIVVWAWCSQLEESEDGVAVAEEYLERMASLEAQYPDVAFVYMTQHLSDRDYEYLADETARVQEANAVIRDYCEANDKWLFDFGDVGIYETADGDVCQRYVDGDANNNPAGDQGRGGDLVPYDCGSETAQALETGHTNYDSRIRRSKVFYWLLTQMAAALE